jgi:Ca2+-binding RTX toxin-like protein
MSATTGDDTLVGTTGPDTIDGLAGNDSIRGDDGADSLYGDFGNDTILGENGNDTLRGESGNDSLDGGAGNDSLTGSFGNDTILGGDNNDRLIGGDNDDSLSGQNGNDVLIGDAGNDTLDGGPGNDLADYIGNTAAQGVNLTAAGGSDGRGGTDTFISIERVRGGDGADTLTFAGGAQSLAGGDGADLIAIGGTGTAVDGGAGTDTLAFTFSGTVTVGGGPGTYTLSGPGGFSATAQNVELIRLNDGSTTAFGTGSFVVCFMAGTRIATPRGEVAVERLRAGDTVLTAGGRERPVLFVGRRRIALAGNPHAAALAPVRIRAGALGEGMPRRDLLVSPDHCLLLDGALVPAGLLVDGAAILREASLGAVTYFHIELESHDALLAEGAAAESWLDTGNRAWFANAAVAMLSVQATPDAYAKRCEQPCAPVVHGGPRLAALRAMIRRVPGDRMVLSLTA